MSKENWGQKGMPPVFVEVKHRAIDFDSEISKGETIWIAGDHPYWGKTINGWSGRETVVRRYIIKKPNEGMNKHPVREYPIIKIVK